MTAALHWERRRSGSCAPGALGEDPCELEDARHPARVVVSARRVLGGVVVCAEYDDFVRMARHAGERRFDVAIGVIAGCVFLRHHRKPEIFQTAFDVRRRPLDVGISLIAAHTDVAGERLDVALESRADQLLIWRERR